MLTSLLRTPQGREDGTAVFDRVEIGARTLKTWTDWQAEDEIGERASVPRVSG